MHSELIKQYVDAAQAHGQATVAGDYKTANSCHDRLVEALRGIRAAGDAQATALSELLRHENLSVRMWAATHLLKSTPDDATRVLEDLARNTGVISFNAKMVLDEWRKGTLKLP